MLQGSRVLVSWLHLVLLLHVLGAREGLKITHGQFVPGQRRSQEPPSCCDGNRWSGPWNDGVPVQLAPAAQ